MAEALLSILGEKIKDAIETGVRLVTGADDDLEWLSSTFSAIQALLHDAEARQFKEESLRNWIANLKDVGYDVDDILDEWRTLQLTAEINASDADGGFIKKVSNIHPLNFSHFSTRYHMAKRVREVRERLDVINDEKDKYQLVPSGKVQRDDLYFEYRKTTCFIEESEVIGRNEEKDAIISSLTSESSSSERGICLISIVGMGGLGKTTLAQLVYNDYMVKSHFKKRIWVCVSDDFNVTSLTKKTLEDANGNAQYNNLSELNTIQKKLVEILGTERFLLVLDDVWNEDREKWETFMLPFKCSGTCGSKILMTTRSEKVASEADASHIHCPKCLSKEDSWSLFSRRAFFGREEEKFLDLQDIGREIVEKCRGVPLSLKTIGGVVRRKRTTEDWKHVLKSEMWVSLQQGGKGILPALLLSYDNLPMHLKQCFAYCAIFPKDHWIIKNDLIRLWMAQGFIRYEEGRQMEEIGSDYFDDLLCYSLFQDAHEDFGCMICKMHDLVHDLAQYVTKNECHIVVNQESHAIPTNCRHLSLIGFEGDPSLLLGKLKYLGTFVFLRRRFDFSWTSSIEKNSLDLPIFLRALDLSSYKVGNLPNSLGNLKHLRYLNLKWTMIKELPEYVCNLCNLQTLDLTFCQIEYLPNSIEKLKHLRYLNLSISHYIKELPESVCNLCHLQTLDLTECHQLSKLPIGLSKLVNLRHLKFRSTGVVNIPKGIGRLTALQTLTNFIVGAEGGCKIGELENLDLLRGCLEISNLERVLNGNEAGEAKLEKKQHLQELFLYFKYMDENEVRMLDKGETKRFNEILKSLRPPNAELKIFNIWNYMGSMFPNWIDESSSFSKLTHIELRGCRKCRKLPTLGTLPSLEYLCIECNDEVESVGFEFTGNGPIAFPKLKTLEFSGMYKWKEWELGVRDGRVVMPCLLDLKVQNCPQLMLELRCLAMPRLSKLEILNIGALHESELPLLSNLEQLAICKVTNLTSLPEDGWERLQSLSTLNIHHCPLLASLPDGLQQFTTLERLSIRGCPYLTESCKKDVGHDWFKIAHIDNICIDCRLIKGSMWNPWS